MLVEMVAIINQPVGLAWVYTPTEWGWEGIDGDDGNGFRALRRQELLGGVGKEGGTHA